MKYVGKGVDRCRISMQKENRDEIQTYLNCQFICPYEAVWRLLQFPVHYKNTSYWSSSSSSSTSSINILYFQVTSLCHQSVLKSPRLDRTMLPRWFQMNTDDPSTHDLYYSQFPNRYVWDVNKKNMVWKEKKASISSCCRGASYIFLECFWTVLKGQQGLV